jgi:hypothetical protein
MPPAKARTAEATVTAPRTAPGRLLRRTFPPAFLSFGYFLVEERLTGGLLATK